MDYFMNGAEEKLLEYYFKHTDIHRTRFLKIKKVYNDKHSQN